METEDLLRNFLTDGVQSAFYQNHGKFKSGPNFLNGDARIKLERVNISGGSFKLKITLPTHPTADWYPSPHILAQDKLVWGLTGSNNQVNEFLSDEYNDNTEIIFINLNKTGSREDRIQFITKANLSSPSVIVDTIVAAYVRFDSWFLVDKDNFFNTTLPKAHYQSQRFDVSMFGVNPLMDGEEPYDMSEAISAAFRSADLMGIGELIIPEGRYTFNGTLNFGRKTNVRGIGKVIFEPMQLYTPSAPLWITAQGPTNTMENIIFKNCYFKEGTQYGNEEVNQIFRNIVFDCPDIDHGGIRFFNCNKNVGGGRWTFDNITINVQQAGCGFWIDNADFVNIKNCHITGKLGTAIRLTAPGSAEICHNRIEGTDYGNGIGIFVGSTQFQLSKNIIIENNIVSGCAGEGISFISFENAESQPILAKSNIASAFVGNDRLLCVELVNSTEFIHRGQAVPTDITTIDPSKCFFVFANGTGLDGDYYLIKDIYEENGKKIVKLATTISDASRILTGSATEANICTGFLDCVIRDNTLSDIWTPNTNGGTAISLWLNVFGMTISNNKIYNGNIGIVASGGSISSGLSSVSNVKILDNYCIGLKIDAIKLEDGNGGIINRNNVIKGNTLIRCRNVSIKGQEDLVFSNNVLKETDLNLRRVDKAILSENYITGEVYQTEMGDEVHFIGNTGSENLEIQDEVIRKEEILKSLLADGVQSAFYQNHGRFKLGGRFLRDGRVKLERVDIGGGSFKLKATLPTHPTADWYPNPYILAQDKLVWGITQSNAHINEFLSNEYNDNTEIIFINVNKSGSREDRIQFITKTDLSFTSTTVDTIVAAYVRFDSWFLVDKDDFFNSTLPKAHHQSQRFDVSMFGVNPLMDGEEPYDMSGIIYTAFRTAELMGMSELCIPEGRYTFNSYLGFGNNIDVRGIGKVIFEPMQPYTWSAPLGIQAQGPTNKMENITFKNCYLNGGMGFSQGTVVNQVFKDIIIDAPELEEYGNYMWLCSAEGGGNWKFENIDINVKHSYVGIMAENADFVEIKNCSIKGSFSHPIRLSAPRSAEIRHNRIEGTGNGNTTGIFIGSNRFQLCRNIIIENNVVSGSPVEQGIALDGFGNNTELQPILATSNISGAFCDEDNLLCIELTNSIRGVHYGDPIPVDITTIDPSKCLFVFANGTGIDGDYYLIKNIYEDNGRKIVQLETTYSDVSRILTGSTTEANICTGFLDCVIRDNTLFDTGVAISLWLNVFGITVSNNKIYSGNIGVMASAGSIFSGLTAALNIKILDNYCIGLKEDAIQLENGYGGIINRHNVVNGNTLVKCGNVSVKGQEDLIFSNNVLKETNLTLTRVDKAVLSDNYITGDLYQTEIGDDIHFMGNTGSENLEALEINKNVLRSFLSDGVQSAFYQNHGRCKLGANFWNVDARFKLERVNTGGSSFKLKLILPTNPNDGLWPNSYVMAQDKSFWGLTGNNNQINEFLSDEYNDNTEIIFINFSKSGSREERIKFITKADLFSTSITEDTIVAAYVKFDSWFLVDKDNFFNSTLPKAHHQTERFDASMFGVTPLMEGEAPYDMSETISMAFKTAELMGMSELCIPEGRYTFNGYLSFGNDINVRGIGKVVIEPMSPYISSSFMGINAQGPTNTMDNITFKNCYFKSGMQYGNEEVNQTFKNIIFDCPDIESGGLYFFVSERHGGGKWTFDNVTINVKQAYIGFYVNNADFVEIKNCNIKGSFSHPIRLMAPRSAEIRHNRIEGTGMGNTTGIFVGTNQVQLCRNIMIENNTVINCFQEYISFDGFGNETVLAPIMAKCKIQEAFIDPADKKLCVALTDAVRYGHAGGTTVYPDITEFDPDKFVMTFVRGTGIDGEYFLIDSIYNDNGRKIVKLNTHGFNDQTVSQILTGDNEANICTGYLDCTIRNNTIYGITHENGGCGISLWLAQYGTIVDGNRIYGINGAMNIAGGQIFSGSTLCSNVQVLNNVIHRVSGYVPNQQHIGETMTCFKMSDGMNDGTYPAMKGNVVSGNTFVDCSELLLISQRDFMFTNNMLKNTDLRLHNVDDALFANNYVRGTVTENQVGTECHKLNNVGL